MTLSPRKHRILLAASATALFTVLLYWPSLKLPIIYDTLLHIRIAKGLDLLNVWLPTKEYGFYRPMVIVPILLVRSLFSYYPAWLLHGLNVTQHALNVALLLGLSWRLWHKWTWAVASGLLLMLFPFAYQAITVNGHHVHPATTGLLLLGLHFYISGIRERKRGWWLLTGLVFLLALLSHETATLFGILAALVHWNDRGREGVGILGRKGNRVSDVVRENVPWILFLLLGGLYALGYQFLPLSRDLGGTGTDAGLWRKALYLMQSAAYPITSWFNRLLPSLGAVPIVLSGLGLVLVLTVWSARRSDNRLPLLLGWGWWFSVSFLLFLMIPSSYLLHGPRLLYLGGAGLALLWPVLLEPLHRIPKLGFLLWTTVLGLTMATGWSYVRDQLHRYTQMTSPVTLMKDVMDERPLDEGILLVNLPGWLSPPRNAYPVGAEHAAMLGGHIFLEELVGENLRADRPVRAIKLPELLTDPGYSYSVFGEKDLSQPIPADWSPAGSQVFVISYTDTAVSAEHVGQLGPVSRATPVAHFGPYHLLDIKAIVCDGRVDVTTTWAWTDDQLPPATLSLFMQVLDANGQLVAQADSPPLGLRFDLIAPVSGWQIVDRRTLQPAAGEPTHIQVGIYNYLDGLRLPARDYRGAPLPEDALRVPIENCRLHSELED
jgi:hypothetical protein